MASKKTSLDARKPSNGLCSHLALWSGTLGSVAADFTTHSTSPAILLPPSAPPDNTPPSRSYKATGDGRVWGSDLSLYDLRQRGLRAKVSDSSNLIWFLPFTEQKSKQCASGTEVGSKAAVIKTPFLTPPRSEVKPDTPDPDASLLSAGKHRLQPAIIPHINNSC